MADNFPLKFLLATSASGVKHEGLPESHSSGNATPHCLAMLPINKQ